MVFKDQNIYMILLHLFQTVWKFKFNLIKYKFSQLQLVQHFLYHPGSLNMESYAYMNV